MLENILHLLSDDNGAINMISNARQYGKLHLFVVHMVSKPHTMNKFLKYRVDNYSKGNFGERGGGDEVEVHIGEGMRFRVIMWVRWKGGMRVGFKVRLRLSVIIRVSRLRVRMRMRVRVRWIGE